MVGPASAALDLLRIAAGTDIPAFVSTSLAQIFARYRACRPSDPSPYYAIPAQSGFGIVVIYGIHDVDRLTEAAQDVPEAACSALDLLADLQRDLRDRIDTIIDRIATAQAEDPLARRRATVFGIGSLPFRAFAAATPDVAASCSALDFGGWLGRTLGVHSIGGEEGLGRESKAGNRYLRRLIYLGASCGTHAFGVMAQIGD